MVWWMLHFFGSDLKRSHGHEDGLDGGQQLNGREVFLEQSVFKPLQHERLNLPWTRVCCWVTGLLEPWAVSCTESYWTTLVPAYPQPLDYPRAALHRDIQPFGLSSLFLLLCRLLFCRIIKTTQWECGLSLLFCLSVEIILEHFELYFWLDLNNFYSHWLELQQRHW